SGVSAPDAIAQNGHVLPLAKSSTIRPPPCPGPAVSQLCSVIVLRVSETEEPQDVPVGIGDRETPQALFDERQLLDERRAAPAELVEERVRVHAVDVRVGRAPFVTSVVRNR